MFRQYSFPNEFVGAESNSFLFHSNSAIFGHFFGEERAKTSSHAGKYQAIPLPHLKEAPAVLVQVEGKIVGIVTRFDAIEYMSR